MIGKNVKGGIVGGLARNTQGADFKAVGIDSASGTASETGDIAFDDSLGAAAKTLGAALGIPDAVLDDNITRGKVVRAAVT